VGWDSVPERAFVYQSIGWPTSSTRIPAKRASCNTQKEPSARQTPDRSPGQAPGSGRRQKTWIPAFARMTMQVFCNSLKSLVIAAAILLAFGDSSPAQEQSSRDLKLVIHKTGQVLRLYKKGNRIRSYRVCLGLEPEGAKRITGDYRTPEGDYFICFKNSTSKYHRFLGISYPGEQDARAAFEAGLIKPETRDAIINRVRTGQAPPWDTELGGWVGIHGYPTDEYKKIWIFLLYPKPHNWTDGCIALWDFEVEELYSMVPVGTPVTIVP